MSLTALTQSNFEFCSIRIEFHAPDEMRVLHQVGVALKEQKLVDHRPKVEPRTAGQTDWIREAARRPKETRV